MNISALDENGNPVDWWFAYKVPKLSGDATTNSATGYEYVYYDPQVGKVELSPNALTDGNGALDLTLESVFDKPDKTTGWVTYNDEKPASAGGGADNGSLGHTKGVIAFDTDSNTAFWLLHSWPKFADFDAFEKSKKGNYEMPTPLYGQTFLCISIDIETAGKIAGQMANHQEPQVYSPRIPDSLPASDPLNILTKPLDPKPRGDADSLDFVSRGGLNFKVLAKNRQWNDDFWNHWVGPQLQVDMEVETWIRGGQVTQDSDDVFQVEDVKFIDFRNLGAPYKWPETKDHAKWGISVESDWICVGDINRMVSQKKRGGGTIAFQDQTLWNALSKTDLIEVPVGKTEAEVREMIKATHQVPAKAA